jgi:hypothetical protein
MGIGLVATDEAPVIKGTCCSGVAIFFFNVSSSTASSSTKTFLELELSQLGISGRASSPPFRGASNSAYCGGALAGGWFGAMLGNEDCIGASVR